MNPPFGPGGLSPGSDEEQGVRNETPCIIACLHCYEQNRIHVAVHQYRGPGRGCNCHTHEFACHTPTLKLSHCLHVAIRSNYIETPQVSTPRNAEDALGSVRLLPTKHNYIENHGQSLCLWLVDNKGRPLLDSCPPHPRPLTQRNSKSYSRGPLRCIYRVHRPAETNLTRRKTKS